MEIILNNNFIMDYRGLRGTRLQEIESQIENLQPELNIPADLLDWAKNCHTVFMDVWTDAGVEMGEKEGSFLHLRELDAKMEETYQDIRLLAIARYANDKDALAEFQFERHYPNRRDHAVKWVRSTAKIAQLQLDTGIACALPQMMIDKLVAAADALETQSDVAENEKFESEHATHALNILFDTDTENLRKLYSWARACWGRYELKFELIGMVHAKHRRAGYPKPPVGLAYDEMAKNFSWDKTHLATSFQLAYAKYVAPPPDTGKKKRIPRPDWEQAYQGAETSVVFDPGEGNWQFKVRARNKHGFGKWSEVLTITA